MKTIAIIPARMGSSRFPGKPMKPIFGMPMIGHIYHRSKMSSSVDEVYVATCDQEIFDYIESIGGKAVMTKDTHERCTERTAEAVEKIEKQMGRKADIVLMLQGDEPMVTPSMIDLALGALKKDSTVQVANLMGELATPEEHADRNEIKVVVDRQSNALYFSREAIPTRHRGPLSGNPRKQVCVIPFRRDFLFDYISWPPSALEIAESIDMNRVLEEGHKVRMVPCAEKSFAVDVPTDIQKVERAMNGDALLKKYLR